MNGQIHMQKTAQNLTNPPGVRVSKTGKNGAKQGIQDNPEGVKSAFGKLVKELTQNSGSVSQTANRMQEGAWETTGCAWEMIFEGTDSAEDTVNTIITETNAAEQMLTAQNAVYLWNFIPVQPEAQSEQSGMVSGIQPVALPGVAASVSGTGAAQPEVNVNAQVTAPVAMEKIPDNSAQTQAAPDTLISGTVNRQLGQAREIEVACEVASGAQSQTETDKNISEKSADATLLTGEAATITADKVLIKVGEPLDITSDSFSAKLAEQILVKCTDPSKSVEIQLHPEHLGKINLKVVFEAGKAVVTMTCENEKTQQLLNAHANSIREIIESCTGRSTAVNKSGDSDMYRQNDFTDGGRNRGQQENHKSQRDSGREETEVFIQRLRLGMAEEAM